jgi:hypothetical protein
LVKGERLEKPEDSLCPQECYDIMLDCWKADQDERPLFLELVQRCAELFLSLKPQDSMLKEKLETRKGKASKVESDHYVDVDGAGDDVCRFP